MRGRWTLPLLAVIFTITGQLTAAAVCFVGWRLESVVVAIHKRSAPAPDTDAGAPRGAATRR